MTDDNPLRRLTKREREVLELLAAGLTVAAVGRQLGLSPRTVESASQRAQRKLHATTVAQATFLLGAAGEKV